MTGKDGKFMGVWPLNSVVLAENCQLDDLISAMHCNGRVRIFPDLSCQQQFEIIVRTSAFHPVTPPRASSLASSKLIRKPKTWAK